MLDGVRRQRKKVRADGNDMKKRATAGVVVIVVLGAALAWYINAQRPTDTHPSMVELPVREAVVEEPPPPEYPIETAQAPAETQPEPLAEPEPLPSLAESDAEMTTALVGLLGAGPVDAWFVTEQFIDHAGAATGGQVPRCGRG
jgi:hypothetical protein